MIFLMLEYARIPSPVVSCITSCYMQLSGFIRTKAWSTPSFSISRGIFQGDTLSPTVFLLVFSPLLHLIQSWQYKGFQMYPPSANLTTLPPIDSYIHLLWNELESEEPPGWYKCKVTEHMANQTSKVEYSSKTHEEIDLRTTEWRYAYKNSCRFIPIASSLPPAPPPPPPPPPPPLANTSTTGTDQRSKAFADDLTLITATESDHQKALTTIESAGNSMGLYFKPSKCVSLTIIRGKPVSNCQYKMSSGHTRNLRDNVTKFLGHSLAATLKDTKRAGSEALKKCLTSAIRNIDRRPIRGEMKVWILRNYVIPSLQFQLSVNWTASTTIAKLEDLICRHVKKWLHLPRNATRIILHHPETLNITPLSHSKTIAKLSLICNIMKSTDPAIQDISHLLNKPTFLKQMDIPKEVVDSSRETHLDNPRKIRKHVKQTLDNQACENLDNRLQSLTVQCKLSGSIKLEHECKLWKRIVDGLPAGHLSFILRSGSDTLPTPMNLLRWNIQLSSKCHLCDHPQATTAHILNGCNVALNDGRYTWRHDSVLRSIVSKLRVTLGKDVHVFADLDGYRAHDSPPATMPPSLITTSARPDIAIFYNQSIIIIELTICGNNKLAMDKARTFKRNKPNYIHLIGDLERIGKPTKYVTIEIGALGHHYGRL